MSQLLESCCSSEGLAWAPPTPDNLKRLGESSATYQGCVLPSMTSLLGSALARDKDEGFTVTVSCITSQQ